MAPQPIRAFRFRAELPTGPGVRFVIRQSAVKRIDIRYRVVVILHDDVPISKSGERCRAVVLDTDYQNTRERRQVMAAHQNPGKRYILTRNSEVPSADLAVLDEAAGHEFSGIDGSGETYALSRQNYGGIYTDHFPADLPAGHRNFPD